MKNINCSLKHTEYNTMSGLHLKNEFVDSTKNETLEHTQIALKGR